MQKTTNPSTHHNLGEPSTASSEEMGDRSVFFKMLRPEIVQKYHSPLSSDAFTGYPDTRGTRHTRHTRHTTAHAPLHTQHDVKFLMPSG
jgi:hypothetical protein